eukprot:3344438-Prymnesium_polylepis.1
MLRRSPSAYRCPRPLSAPAASSSARSTASRELRRPRARLPGSTLTIRCPSARRRAARTSGGARSGTTASPRRPR